MREVDAHAAEGRGEVGLEARAARVRDHGDLVLVADAGDLGDLRGGLRVGDGDGQLVDVDGGPFGVAMSAQVVVVGANGVGAEEGAEFGDGLGGG